MSNNKQGMKLYTEEQMRDAIKMARNGARSEDNIIGSLNFIKQHSEVTMTNDKQIDFDLQSFFLGILTGMVILLIILTILL